MYVAPQSDKDWLRHVQRALYQRSQNDPDYVFRKLWGFVTDPRNLRLALQRVARNRGRRTPGIDGVTVWTLVQSSGVEAFVQSLREELRHGTFCPSPVRRVLIPKPGQPGEYRPLGIPTVQDRVAQAALKNILEPVFEADFFPVSYGFRPGRGVHGALEHLRLLLRPRPVRVAGGTESRLPYQWAVEGDIQGCFDHIAHHALMRRLGRRIGDAKVVRMFRAFLKAGILSAEQFTRTDAGVPQGGILSPLAANIALSAIEERYTRHVWPRRTPTLRTDPEAITRRAHEARTTDRRRGLPIVFPIRYADDFILLVSAPPGPDSQEQAHRFALAERDALAAYLRDELGLELSSAKTFVTPVTTPMRFLGHHVRVRRHPGHHRMASATLVPKDRSQLFRERIKRLFARPSLGRALRDQLRRLNPMLRGWAHFYRHAWGAKKVFAFLDHYVWWTIARWLKKKHRVSLLALRGPYAWRKPGGRALRWRDGDETLFEAASVCVEQFKLGWVRGPDFAAKSMESPVHNERCTPGSGRGRPETDPR